MVQYISKSRDQFGKNKFDRFHRKAINTDQNWFYAEILRLEIQNGRWTVYRDVPSSLAFIRSLSLILLDVQILNEVSLISTRRGKSLSPTFLLLGVYVVTLSGANRSCVSAAKLTVDYNLFLWNHLPGQRHQCVWGLCNIWRLDHTASAVRELKYNKLIIRDQRAGRIRKESTLPRSLSTKRFFILFYRRLHFLYFLV
jgi:hypothetical protein